MGHMAVVLAAVVALFVCAVVGVAAWSATIALKLGKFTNRNGIEISRRNDPFIFWLSIFLGFVPLAACLYIGLCAYSVRSWSRFPAHRERGFQLNVNTIPA
jgi:hypothetical protein